jgi:beta-galactosidase
MVNFEVSGSGGIAGVASGNPTDISGFQQPKKKAYQGVCLVILRPKATPGKIYISATAEGLKGTSLTIRAD